MAIRELRPRQMKHIRTIVAIYAASHYQPELKDAEVIALANEFVAKTSTSQDALHLEVRGRLLQLLRNWQPYTLRSRNDPQTTVQQGSVHPKLVQE